MDNEKVAEDLIILAKELVSGCEKLPEGGMRDNCEKKKEKGGDKEEKGEKKEASGRKRLTGADDYPSDLELRTFHRYVMDFYGVNGIYVITKRGRNLNIRDLMKATDKLLKSNHDWARGDSFDREKVRDILLASGYEWPDDIGRKASADRVAKSVSGASGIYGQLSDVERMVDTGGRGLELARRRLLNVAKECEELASDIFGLMRDYGKGSDSAGFQAEETVRALIKERL